MDVLMIQKYKKLLLGALAYCLVVQFTYAIQPIPVYEIHTINPQNIEKSHQTIIREVRNHKLWQIATVSGTALAAGIGLYLVFGRDSTPISTAESSAAAGKLELTPDQTNIIQELILEKAYKAGKYFKNSWGNWITQQFYLQTHQLAQGVAVAVIFNLLNNSLGPISKYLNQLNGFLDRTISGIFHKVNYEWFMSNYCNINQTYNMLERYAATFEGRSLQIQPNALMNATVTVEATTDQESLARIGSLKDVVDYWNLYIQQIEMVLGFIQYTSKGRASTNLLESGRMQAISEKITLLTNTVGTSLQQKIKNVENNTTLALYDELHELRALTGQELSNFSLLESFRRHDFVV